MVLEISIKYENESDDGRWLFYPITALIHLILMTRRRPFNRCGNEGRRHNRERKHDPQAERTMTERSPSRLSPQISSSTRWLPGTGCDHHRDGGPCEGHERSDASRQEEYRAGNPRPEPVRHRPAGSLHRGVCSIIGRAEDSDGAA